MYIFICAIKNEPLNRTMEPDRISSLCNLDQIRTDYMRKITQSSLIDSYEIKIQKEWTLWR